MRRGRRAHLSLPVWERYRCVQAGECTVSRTHQDIEAPTPMASQVSQWFRDIVDGSVLLQYIVECFLVGVVNNPARRESMRERLASIRRWHAAIRHPQWTAGASSPVSMQAWHSILIFGAVYVVQEGDRIIITQPPSEVKGRTEKQWVIDTGSLKFEPYVLEYDHNQKLLALVEQVYAFKFASYSAMLTDEL